MEKYHDVNKIPPEIRKHQTVCSDPCQNTKVQVVL